MSPHPYACFFFFIDPAPTETSPLSLHDALPICPERPPPSPPGARPLRPADAAGLLAGRSEEHTSELQSRGLTSYAGFCFKKNRRAAERGGAGQWSAAGGARFARPRR